MSLVQQALGELSSAHQFFNRSISNLPESLSEFAPAPGTMTAAQQVAHAAQTIDWFMEGTFRPEGFDMDFEAHAKAISEVKSLDAAKAWFEKAVASAKEVLAGKSDDDLIQPIPPGPIMGGLPRLAVLGAITDHTAHHRGALTVYARLNGIIPPMPYL